MDALYLLAQFVNCKYQRETDGQFLQLNMRLIDLKNNRGLLCKQFRYLIFARLSHGALRGLCLPPNPAFQSELNKHLLIKKRL